MYDLHGSDYARVQQHEQQERARRQQEDFFNAFGGGGRGRRSGAPPIFSSTTWIGSDAYRDLVEDSTDSWLVQFYHDWSEPCKEFAARWEALAAKLPPMVRLARIHIDQNFGLVQRYRSFVRCRQNVSAQCLNSSLTPAPTCARTPSFANIVASFSSSSPHRPHHPRKKASLLAAPRFTSPSALSRPPLRPPHSPPPPNLVPLRPSLSSSLQAFYMECTAPAIVLITPSADGQLTAEAFRGSFPPSAEQIYEWVKRSLPESRRTIPALRPSEEELARFLAPPWAPPGGTRASLRQSKAESAGRGRQLAKGCIFSARPIAESLFARYLTSALGERLSSPRSMWTEASTPPPQQRSSRASTASRLPPWRYGPTPSSRTAGYAGQTFSIDERPDAARGCGSSTSSGKPPYLPSRSCAPANYFDLCGPSRSGGGAGGFIDEEEAPPFCVLLFVDAGAEAGGQWPTAAVDALDRMRAVAPNVSSAAYASLGWTRGGSQAFARHVLGGAGACASSGGLGANGASPRGSAQQQQQQQRRQQQQQPAAAACTDEVLPVAIVGMQSRLLGLSVDARRRPVARALVLSRCASPLRVSAGRTRRRARSSCWRG